MSAGCVAASVGPWYHERRVPRLRVLGTHVTLQERIRRKAESDLGIELEFRPGGSAEVLQEASTRPEDFDVFEQWSNTIPVLWQAGAIQAIDTTRIDAWEEINALSKRGRLEESTRMGAGNAPHEMLYVQSGGSLGPLATSRASYLPYVHNADSFGYRLGQVDEGTPYETESWSWLLDERWRGKVAIVNEPTIGIFDAALAAQAIGAVEFEDIGNMTRKEIDRLFDLLVDMQRNGHFYGVWNSVPESVAFMQSKGVLIESMFSPAVSTLNKGKKVVNYAAPREGYRAWQGVMCLSSSASDEATETAYRFMNWWLSGWPGAVMARQGYYISVPSRTRRHLRPSEWAYYYDGKPATEDLPGPDGGVTVRKGELRRGGSYHQRFSNIAVWNTVMDNYEYSMLRWAEFLTA